MLSFLQRHWPRLTGYLLAGVLAAAAGGLLFAWSGFYNVAASAGHWWITNQLLTLGMRSSVRTHAIGIEAPPLDDPNMVRLGAGHFEGGCVACHGSPEGPASPIADQMLPAPPVLPPVIPHWESEELFWIVKHGLKYTSMPGWVAIERDDEVWAMTAFLEQLPGMSAERYRDLARGGTPVSEASARGFPLRGTPETALAACGHCHGLDGRAPPSNLVPRLSGQPAEYLYSQLKAYAGGVRPSGFMQPVVAGLDDRQMRELAGFYAGFTPVAQPRAALPAGTRQLELGSRIATEGVPDQGIPACGGCHGPEATDRYPRLAGQHGAYIAGQLRLWKAGGRAKGELAAIMRPIAQRLTDEQIAAVAGFYNNLPPEPVTGTEAR